MHQCAREHEALGHAPGIVHHLIFSAITQAEFIEQGICTYITFCARHTMITGVKRQYLTRSQTAVKVALLRDDCDTLLDTHRICNHIYTHNVRFTTCGFNICGQYTNGRSLPSSVWSEEAKNLAAWHGKGDVINGIECCLGITFHQVLNFN